MNANWEEVLTLARDLVESTAAARVDASRASRLARAILDLDEESRNKVLARTDECAGDLTVLRRVH